MNGDTWAIVLATAFGPIAAVAITLWHQGRKQRQDEKSRIFLTIMANRKSFPATYEWANALNLIVVVFSKSPAVKTAWADLYEFVQQIPVDNGRFHQKQLVLLSAMARDLGYADLEQVDIDKFYSPQVHGDIARLNAEIQQEWLRVLRHTEALSVVPRKDTPPQSQQPPAVPTA